MPGLLESVADHPLVAMVSLMDHSPGVGQYRDLARYRAMRIKQTRMTDAEIEVRILKLQAQRAELRERQRRLVIDRTGEELAAPASFMLVASYNPGYQSILKKLKPSTRQRFVSIGFDFPDPATETAVLTAETGLDATRAGALVRLAGHIRNLSGMDLEEGVSTRLLVYAATLIAGGMSVERALEAAIIAPLSDEPEVQQALRDLTAAVYG